MPCQALDGLGELGLDYGSRAATVGYDRAGGRLVTSNRHFRIPRIPSARSLPPQGGAMPATIPLTAFRTPCLPRAAGALTVVGRNVRCLSCILARRTGGDV